MKWLILAATAFAAMPAHADDIQLGQPVYGGSGCPQGSAAAVLSPDNKALSILFDSYTIEAGGATRKRIDRKSCNLAIPLHVPHGLSVSIIEADYRGFNALPAGAVSRFNAEYFFAGGTGPVESQVFSGPTNDDFTISHAIGLNSIVWSACGADTIFRVNSNMMVQSMRGEDALSSIDSVDVGAGILYQLQWKTCGDFDLGDASDAPTLGL